MTVQTSISNPNFFIIPTPLSAPSCFHRYQSYYQSHSRYVTTFSINSTSKNDRTWDVQYAVTA